MQPSLVLLVLLVLVALAVGGAIVVCIAAAAFFAWSRERCRRDSHCDGTGQEEQQREVQQQQGSRGRVTAAGALGSGGEDELSAQIQRILGSNKPLQQATADDIKGLSKEEFLRLFALLPPATPEALQGEWHGDVLAMGWNYPVAYLLLHWRMGHGWYLGKGFDAESRTGYNTFYHHGTVSRSRRFDVLYEGPSAYDEQRSLHLVYGRFNTGLFRRVHEEVRCLHPELFLGLGSINPKWRSSFNSLPFLLVGPRQPARPWDRERN